MQKVDNKLELERAIRYAIERGYQMSPKTIEFLKLVSQEPLDVSHQVNLISIISSIIEKKSKEVSQNEFVENALTITETDLVSAAPSTFEKIGPQEAMVSEKSDIEIVFDPSFLSEKKNMGEFSDLFRNRYEKLLKIFQERPEARQLVKISDNATSNKNSWMFGLVFSKRQVRNGVELTFDDSSGRMRCLAVTEESKRATNGVSLDQAIMINLQKSTGGSIFIRNLIQPDLPIRTPRGSTKDVYAIFLSDLHVGSNKFLSRSFSRFLEWINGKVAVSVDDQYVLSHLKYVVIAGDVVDGVGVFPNQEYELIQTDISKQYEMVAELLKNIPSRFTLIVIPGNHDSTRQALPQPRISTKYAESLYNLDNVKMLGDPCVIKLEGVRVLVYHGRSLDDVLATTPGLSYDRPTGPMKMLLKARHLAPMFGSRTPIAPEIEDYLVIEEPPDIFHSGHIHTVGAESYRGTLIVNSGAWQAQTSYQANLGIVPTPGVIPFVNLRTLEVVFRQFLTDGETSFQLGNK